MNNTPILEGNVVRKTLRVYCDHCNKQHIHGLTDDLLAGQTSPRSAHCQDFSSPYRKTGYRIKIKDKKNFNDKHSSI